MKISLASDKDAAAILNIYKPFIENTIISFEEEFPSLMEMKSRIQAANSKHCWLCLYDGDTLAGYAYGGAHRQRAAYQYSCESSIYMHENYIGRGLAKPFYLFLLETLRTQGFAQCFAGISQPNPVSDSFHQSCGFHFLGTYKRVGYKYEKWHDTNWYQLELIDEENFTADLLPIAEVFRQDSWLSKKNKLEIMLKQFPKSS